jgi:hypothetical protein
VTGKKWQECKADWRNKMLYTKFPLPLIIAVIFGKFIL